MNKGSIKDYFMLTLGSLLFAVGIYFFRLPNSFVVGGASGLSIILSKLFPVISAGTFITAINVISIIVGILFLGKGFSRKTIYCSIVYSLVILAFEQLWVIQKPLTDDVFLEFVCSIVLCGVGAGLVIHTGGSTGGIEIFALILRKKTHLTAGNALMYFNLLIALFSAFICDIKTCLFSLLGVLVHSILVDNVIQALDSERFLIIVTKDTQQICDYINNEMHTCATIVRSLGSYSNTENNVIFIAVSPRASAELKRHICKMSEGSIVITLNTFDIIGRRYKK